MPTTNSNPRPECVRRKIRLPHPRVLALALSCAFEIVEACFGPRQRRLLEAVARRTADLYGSDAAVFRKRLDSALNNRHLQTVDWWEDAYGEPTA